MKKTININPWTPASEGAAGEAKKKKSSKKAVNETNK